MAVEVIEKRKGSLICKECDEALPDGADECPTDGDHKIQKSLVVVRKSVGEVEDDLEVEDAEDELDDDDEVEDEADVDEEDDEDDEEEEDDDEEDDDEGVQKNFVAVEALSIGTALAEDIAKCFTRDGKFSMKKYESVMTELNNVTDAAAMKWSAGQTVSKSNSTKALVRTITGRVSEITKTQEETVAKPKTRRPKGLDLDALPDEARDYITSLEGGEVEKRLTRKGLPKEIRKSLDEADKLIEKNAQEEWLKVAKAYSHVDDPQKLAKTLRALDAADPTACEELRKSLDQAEERIKQGDIFKSFGAPGAGSPDSEKEAEITKRMKDDNLTREQAEVALMDGKSYAPTNA